MFNCQVWFLEAIPFPDDFWIFPHSTQHAVFSAIHLEFTWLPSTGEKKETKPEEGAKDEKPKDGDKKEFLGRKISRFDCNMIAAKMVEFQQFKAEIYPFPISQKSRCCLGPLLYRHAARASHAVQIPRSSAKGWFREQRQGPLVMAYLIYPLVNVYITMENHHFIAYFYGHFQVRKL